MFKGHEVIITDAIPKVEVFIPIKKHRQKRIQKKYNKKFGFKSRLDEQMVVFNNKIYMSPNAYEKIKDRIC